MVDVGAAGETDTQLRSVLQLPGTGAAVAPAHATLACADETDGSADGQQLSLANSIWAQGGKTFEPAFLSVLSRGYDAPLQQVDFAGDVSGARSAVNAWVSQQTQEQITDLLQAGDLDALAAVSLTRRSPRNWASPSRTCAWRSGGSDAASMRASSPAAGMIWRDSMGEIRGAFAEEPSVLAERTSHRPASPVHFPRSTEPLPKRTEPLQKSTERRPTRSGWTQSRTF